MELIGKWRCSVIARRRWDTLPVTRHRNVREVPTWNEQLEDLAATIVGKASDVQFERHDIRGGAPGRADYALHGPEGECVGLLEVTSVTDSQMNGTLSSLEKRLPRLLAGSRFYWSITLDGLEARADSLQHRLTDILTELESTVFAAVSDHGTVYIGDPDGHVVTESGLADALTREMYGLGIQSVSVLADVEPEHRGYVARATTMGVNSVGPDAVTVAVDHELAKNDNQKKLRKAGANRRAELFVWLDAPRLRIAAFHALARDAFDVEKLIGRPNLPDGITAVWAAPTLISEDAGQYWYSDGGPWRSGIWEAEPPGR